MNNNLDDNTDEENLEKKFKQSSLKFKENEIETLKTINSLKNLNLEKSKLEKSELINAYNTGTTNGTKIINNNNLCYTANANNISLEKLKEENLILKADNLMFLEDINKYKDINANLEFNLLNLRTQNLSLLKENENLNNDLNLKQNETSKLNEALTKLKIFENPELDSMIINSNKKDCRIKELDLEIKNLKEESFKNKILENLNVEKFKELKEINYDLDLKLKRILNKENYELENFSENLKKLEQNLEFSKKEAKDLKLIEEKHKNEIINLKNLKEKFEAKFFKLKEKYQSKKQNLKNVELELKNIKIKNESENIMKFKEEETKKQNLNKKQKVYFFIYYFK